MVTLAGPGGTHGRYLLHYFLLVLCSQICVLVQMDVDVARHMLLSNMYLAYSASIQDDWSCERSAVQITFLRNHSSPKHRHEVVAILKPAHCS